MKKRLFFKLPTLLFFILISIGISTNLQSTTIVFDAGGVLIQTKKKELAKKFMGKFIRYALSNFKSPAHLKNLTFSVLEELYGEQIPEKDCPCAYGDGIKLPAIMCDWLAGHKTGKEIIDDTHTTLCDKNYDYLFKNNQDKDLVNDILCMIFDPELHASACHPIPEGVALLEECANVGDVMLLSNYAADSFEKIYNKEEMQNTIFNLIPAEKIIVSGFIGMIKPYTSIFNYLLSSYSLKAEDVLFIDDQEENIKTAAQLGIKTIQVKNGNFKAVRKELEALHIL